MASSSQSALVLPEILTTSRFYIELTVDNAELVDGFFMDCQGFQRSFDTIEITEVTPKKWGKEGKSRGRVVRTKIPGNTKSDNITLKRGLCRASTFWKWFAAVEQGQWAEQYRTGDITIYSQGGTEEARFRFEEAWPASYKLGDLSASGSELQIEELELAVQEFYRIV
ncbi:MAG: phage tail protein [Spirulina sp.]